MVLLMRRKVAKSQKCGIKSVFQAKPSVCRKNLVSLHLEVTKRVYFIGNERMLIAHDSNRLRFS